MSKEVIEFAFKLYKLFYGKDIHESKIYELVSLNKPYINSGIFHERRINGIYYGENYNHCGIYYNIKTLGCYTDSLYDYKRVSDESHKCKYPDTSQFYNCYVNEAKRHKLYIPTEVIDEITNVKSEQDYRNYKRNSVQTGEMSVLLSSMIIKYKCMEYDFNEFGFVDFRQVSNYFAHFLNRNINNTSYQSTLEQNAVRLECKGFGNVNDIMKLMEMELHPYQIYTYLWEEKFGKLEDQLSKIYTIDEVHSKEIDKLKSEFETEMKNKEAKFNDRVTSIKDSYDKIVSDRDVEIINLKSEIQGISNLANYMTKKYNTIANERDELEFENERLKLENEKLSNQLRTIFTIKDSL